MSYYRVIDPAEVAFFRWLNHYPKSFHPYDKSRFYSFVDVALHYRKSYGKKWLNKEFFISQCKKYKPSLDDECIASYWNRLEVIKERSECKRSMQLTKCHVFNDDFFSYYAQIVVDEEIKTVSIDKETYDRKYLSKTDILKRIRGERVGK